MLNLDLVMPMTGAGKRVKEISSDVHKPFINLENRPLYMHAYNSLARFANIHMKVATLPAGAKPIPEFECVFPTQMTNGPLESAVLAIEKLTSSLPFAILDCDLSLGVDFSINSIQSDASIFTFTSGLDKYSFARVDKGHVLEVAEKKVISNRAIAGCYIFKSKDVFLEHARRQLSLFKDKRELYISDVLSSYLLANLRIQAFKLSSFCSLGTSQEIYDSGFKISLK